MNEPSGPGVRVDSSIFSGIEIPYFYDPMLAKLICWGADRTQAIGRMKRALREYVIAGIKTNIPFHLQLLDDPRFVAGEVHTGFLDSEFKMVEPTEYTDEEQRRAARRSGDVAQPARAQRRAAGGDHAGRRNSWRDAGRDRQIASRGAMAQQGNRWRRSTG